MNSVKSKQRVADHGEVFTNEREVNAMLDLVKAETERIDSRFLEPACGNGNFLAEVAARKLMVVEQRYRRSQLDWERNAVLAISSVYGIDILEDNVAACRERLFQVFDNTYTARFKRRAKAACRKTVRFILQQNIVWGDALSLRTVDDHAAPIIFSEWAFATGSFMKRRTFAFHELMPSEAPRGAPSLFDSPRAELVSDNGERDVFIPTPVDDYPLIHFLELADEQENEEETQEEAVRNGENGKAAGRVAKRLFNLA